MMTRRCGVGRGLADDRIELALEVFKKVSEKQFRLSGY
jgi:hypothetical protein